MSETVPQAEGRLRGEELVEEIDGMKYADRSEFVLAFLGALRESYCDACGNMQPLHGWCQCAHDE